jgi:hypothetical protein
MPWREVLADNRDVARSPARGDDHGRVAKARIDPSAGSEADDVTRHRNAARAGNAHADPRIEAVDHRD